MSEQSRGSGHSDAILDKWRNEPSTQDQLRQHVLSVLTHIFDKGEEVPVVVSVWFVWGGGANCFVRCV